MRVACYIRVSTGAQNLEGQKAAIQDWCNHHNIENITWYEDVESASSVNRSNLKKLQKDITMGQVDTVVIWKLDRLARSQIEGINLISDWCDRGVRLISVTQNVDLSGTIGHMIAGLLFGIAEIELSYIRERQAIGIEQAKKRGVYKGRLKGTTKAKPERAKSLLNKGLELPEIAKSLGVSERTVHRYIKEAA